MSKYAILLLFPFHLGLMYLFADGNCHAWCYFAAVLFILLTDFVLSFRQLDIMHSNRNNVLDFGAAFIPYFLQKLALAAAEWGLIFWIRKGDFSLPGDGSGISMAGIAASTAMGVSALVTFVTGAGRTMMYHDEKR